MNLYDAIYYRKSVRKYRPEPVPEKILNMIHRYENEVEILYPDIQYRMDIVDMSLNNRVVKGNRVKAPYYLVFYSEVKEGYLQNAGCILEQMVLYMAMKGLGTCYLGNGKALPTTSEEGYREVMIVAFGYPAEDLYRSPDKAKRFSLDELSIFKEDVDESIRTVLEAARLAPSGMNLQPWRFVAYNNRIHVFARKKLPILEKEMRDVDLGIAVAHILLAAEELWLEATVAVSNQMADYNFKNNQYVLSILLK